MARTLDRLNAIATGSRPKITWETDPQPWRSCQAADRCVSEVALLNEKLPEHVIGETSVTSIVPTAHTLGELLMSKPAVVMRLLRLNRHTIFAWKVEAKNRCHIITFIISGEAPEV